VPRQADRRPGAYLALLQTDADGDGEGIHRQAHGDAEKGQQVHAPTQRLIGLIAAGLSSGFSRPHLLVIAVEVKEPKGFGRLRMRHVPDVSGASLQPFAGDVIAQGVTVRMDGWTGYNGLLRHGYVHERTVLSSSGDPAHVSMPGVHRVAALLKRWILGTHQGSVTPAHQQSYLEEFTFRFNRRSSGSRGLVFRRLIEQAVVAGPLTEAELTFGYDWSRSQGRRS